MPAANVKTYEENFAVRVEGIEGVYNSIVIPAKKGPINVPTLVSGENDLLKLFTPNMKVEVGFNLAYYSALAVLNKTNKLWVTRCANNALFGGVLVNPFSDVDGYDQVDQTTEEQLAMTFNVSAISDISAEVVVSGLQGGSVDDLDGREIVIEGVGTHTVASISGNTLTLDGTPTQSITFANVNDKGTIEAVDYISFDVNYGTVEEAVTVIYVTGMSSGSTEDLVGSDITLFDGDSKSTRTVDSVDGTAVTLSTATDVVVNRVGTGYDGTPEVTFDVLGAVDGGTTISVSNINPSHIDELIDMEDKTATLTLNMTDGTQTLVSTTLATFTAGEFTVTVFADPELPTDADGTAAYIAAVATGFTDPTAIDKGTSVFALSAESAGDWSQDIRIEILTGREVKEINAFIIRVYHKDNLNVPLEVWEVSRVAGQKNGYGRNMFIESILEGSQYIDGFNNVLVDELILPKETVTRDDDGNVISRSYIMLTAGDDGDAVTDSDMITSADLMENRNSYPLSIMLDGGWATPAYQIRLTQICENRDDSIAVLSVPYEVEASADYANEIVKYRNLDLNINSSYCALYSCHVKITDKYNNRQIFVSPDGYAAAAINESASSYEIWYPPAGYKRGKILVEDTLRRFTDGELDLLYDAGINPIRFAPGKGIAIWGQLTLELRPSIKDRLNVRLLLNEVKPAITTMLEQVLFELNEIRTRKMVQISITDYLRSVKSRNGLVDFHVVSDDTNNSAYDMDNHILNVDVYLKPMHSIEYINFTTILTDTGVEFSVVTA